MEDDIDARGVMEKLPAPPAVEQEDADTTMRTARSHVRSDVSRTWQMGPMGNFVTKSVMALGIVVGSAESSFARKWADNTGRHSVEADFVALKDDAVILRKENGTEITVPLSRLSDSDVAHAQQLARKSSAPPGASTAEEKDSAKTKDLPKTKTWKDRLGKTMHATFVREVNGKVVFLVDNKVTSYWLHDLSAEDQEYVKRLVAADSPSHDRARDRLSRESKSSMGRDLATAFSELDEKEKGKDEGSALPDFIRERIEVYKDTENNSLDTRLQAIREIGKYGEAAAPALPFLRELLLLRDFDVRGTAMDAIAGIGAPAVPTLVAIMETMKDPENFAREAAAVEENRARVLAGFRGGVLRGSPIQELHLTEMALHTLRNMGAGAKEAIPILLDLSLESDSNFQQRSAPPGPVILGARPEYDAKKRGNFRLAWGTDATCYFIEALDVVRKLNPDLETISPRLIEIIKIGIPRVKLGDMRTKLGYSVLREGGATRSHLQNVIGMVHQMETPPKDAVPVLMAAFSMGLSPSEIIEIFGKIGPDAAAALPLLRSKLEVGNLGKSAEKAIAQITGTHAKDGSDATGEAAGKPEVEKTDEAEYSFAEPTELPGALTWDLNDRDFKKWFKIIGKSYDEEKNQVRWDLEWKNSDNLTFGKVVSVRGLRFRFHFYDAEMNEVVVVRGKFSDPYGRVLLMEVPDKRALDKTNKVILRVTLR